MPTLVIVGALWGDEAKGKLVDVLGEDADFNVRYSGGNNAGHTVKVAGETFKFQLIPSGILHERCTAVLGGGMVICPRSLLEELDGFREVSGRQGNLLISGSAHVVFPYHRTLDAVQEKTRGEDSIGTTRRGIGPAYGDKVARVGIRMWEFIDETRFRGRLQTLVAAKNEVLRDHLEEELDFDSLFAEYSGYAARLKPLVGEAERVVNDAIYAGRKVVFEGAQGTLLDLDEGTYPYVTSSHPTSGGACIGSGLPPTRVDNVLGVGAAYATRVGTGPFPSELEGPVGERIRVQGNEFGTVTGRPRRCGWIDLVALRHAARLNGFTSLAITRLDVLSGFEQVGACVAYDVGGEKTDRFPSDTARVACAEPVVEMLPGWDGDLSSCRTFDELPAPARAFLEFVEERVGVPVSLVSVGPERTETIVRLPRLIWA
jgi:adenylosuccinate synthase